MFENLKQGWELGKATRQLVMKDKQLLVYPIIAIIATVIELVAIFGIIVFAYISSPTGTTAAASTGPPAILVFAFLLFLYILLTFTTTYVTMAMFIAFRSYVSGKRISIGAALGQTSSYSMLILEWAIFYGIIITLVKIIESRMRGVAQLIFGAIISIALSLATMFVIQVILDDRVGPIEAMKRSEQTLVHAFGKTFGGIIYSDLYGLMFSLAGIALIIIGAILTGASVILGITILVLGFVLLLAGAVIGGVLSNIYRLILYDYIKTGNVPQGFTKQMLENSVKQKKGGNQ